MVLGAEPPQFQGFWGRAASARVKVIQHNGKRATSTETRIATKESEIATDKREQNI